MPSVNWQHNRTSLLLPIAILAGATAPNPTEMLRCEGLLDTGATGTGIRADIARRLGLRAKGQRRVNTANGLIYATEFLFRVGFITGDCADPSFDAEQQQPYVLDEEVLGFELAGGFTHQVLIGMDIIGRSDLVLLRDGRAKLTLG